MKTPAREGPARAIGVDTGGTFTDVVVWRDGRQHAFKVPSTPAEPSRAVLEGLRRARSSHDARAARLDDRDERAARAQGRARRGRDHEGLRTRSRSGGRTARISTRSRPPEFDKLVPAERRLAWTSALDERGRPVRALTDAAIRAP